MSKTILVVDDESTVVGLIKEAFEADHYAVATASRGDDALKQVQLKRPDLIILDIMMPGMDGYAVCKELRRKFSSDPIPVIVLTGKDQLKDLLEMEGVADYMTKPFRMADLRARVRKHCEG